MRVSFKHLVVGSLLLLGGAACADLDVVNYNSADAARALATPSDVEALIKGSFGSQWSGGASYSGLGPILSNASFQHTAPWANFGMEQYGRIPRITTVNDPSDGMYSYLVRAWTYNYRAIAAIADGLRALENEEISSELGPEAVARAKAYAKFVQALAHADLALHYDMAFVVTEDTDLSLGNEPVAYPELLDIAMGLFDEAIALCGTSFDLGFDWMAGDVSNQDLQRFAHSLKARYMAETARTPAERAAVNWNAVIQELDQGITEDWMMNMDWEVGWSSSALHYAGRPDWGQLNNFVWGMADQSGNYQEWLSLPFSEKSYEFSDGRLVLWVTPDLRFPQGSTLAEQRANDNGAVVRISTASEAGSVWARPDRGTWRWGWYKSVRGTEYRYKSPGVRDQPYFSLAEARLLKAEALFRTGNKAAAAAIINETRVPAGLNPADAAGTNTSCVPKLPNGSCGDLWEMLKWEKRVETVYTGIEHALWYYDSRGWGDLFKGTFLQLGTPCQELQVLQMEPCMNYGGPGGEFGSPGSTYAYPHEG
ncbi:MAG: RagB/SusD family nutrient uptake outer membrane protein [Gemmatimonadota bacterium]